MGAVVVTYNIPGVAKGLKLNSEDVANIYLGKITMWNDPKIADDNKGIALPAKPIIVVHRSDGSGTTSIFTDYLTGVNAEWAQKVGKGGSVKWPVGLGGKGNEGVAGQVKTTPYTIGYVELAYAASAGPRSRSTASPTWGSPAPGSGLIYPHDPFKGAPLCQTADLMLLRMSLVLG